jgi:hypothetical protein
MAMLTIAESFDSGITQQLFRIAGQYRHLPRLVLAPEDEKRSISSKAVIWPRLSAFLIQRPSEYRYIIASPTFMTLFPLL